MIVKLHFSNKKHLTTCNSTCAAADEAFSHISPLHIFYFLKNTHSFEQFLEDFYGFL